MLGLGQIFVGVWDVYKKTKQRERWFRTIASIGGTAFVTFWGTWGFAIETLNAAGFDHWAALVLGFAKAVIAMAAMVLYLWKRNPLTREIPIAAPMKVEEKVLEGGQTFTQSAKEKK